MSNDKDQSMESEKSLTSPKNQQGFLTELWQQARLFVRLFLDSEVPIYLKLIPVAAIAYLLFPIDFLPDVIPGIGQLDDLTILIVGAKMFIEMAPQHIVEKYLFEMQNSFSGLSASKEDIANDQDIIEGIILEEEVSNSN